ncbi:MAG TPA: hypothetical protein VGA07_07430 [Anaerolineales bacterium]
MLVAVVALGLGACGTAVEPSAPAPLASEPIPTSAPSPTRGLTVQPTPSLPVPQATEKPRPAGTCPPAPEDVPIPSVENPINFGDALVQYLNAGGSIEQLVEQADQLNVLTMPTEQGSFARPDLNGDGLPEIALALADWTSPPAQGRLFLALCEAGSYRLIPFTPEGNDAPVVQIHAAFDLTGDAQDDLLIGIETCGASTCFQDFDLLVWREQRLRDLLVDYSSELPSPGIQVFGTTMDGSRLFVITVSGFSSAGGGPYQTRALTYGRDPDSGLFNVLDLRLQPSSFRIHVLHGGDRSFALGNYPAALDAYNRVILDDDLDDWPSDEFDPELPGRRRLELAAYARFRRILVRLKMDDPASAQVHYQDLIDHHPAGAPGAGFSRMGQVFWEEFTASGDLNAACAAAQSFAADHPSEVLHPPEDLGPLEYGYGNPEYSPAGLCPTTP